MMAIMILAISLLLNVVLVSVCYNMNAAWKDDINRFIKIYHRTNDEWNAKYTKLSEEYEQLVDEEDDLK